MGVRRRGVEIDVRAAAAVRGLLAAAAGAEDHNGVGRLPDGLRFGHDDPNRFAGVRIAGGDDHIAAEHAGDAQGVNGTVGLHSRAAVDLHGVTAGDGAERVRAEQPRRCAGVGLEEVAGRELTECSIAVDVEPVGPLAEQLGRRCCCVVGEVAQDAPVQPAQRE